MSVRLAAWVLGLMLAAAALPAAAADAPRFDWTTWQALPVYPQDLRDPNKGRVMPLDTFAREMVEVVCGRSNPTLVLKGAVSDAEYDSPDLKGARSLFPDGKPRKFQAVELVYSWLVEPEKWEHVPFLIAEHQELREELLDVPFTNPETGEHLKYVSPSQVRDADGFQLRLQELDERQQMARVNGEKFELVGVDKKVEELVQAFNVYRQLMFDTELDGAARRAFGEALGGLAESWIALDSQPEVLDALGEHAGVQPSVKQAREAMQALAGLAQVRQYTIDDLQPPLTELHEAATVLAEELGKVARAAGPEGFDEERVGEVRRHLAEIAARTFLVRERTLESMRAMYQSEETLRVVPALDATALSRDRDVDENAPPWLDLQTLLSAPPAVLADYPADELEDVRAAFNRARLAYLEQRTNDFADYSRQFAQSLAALAMDVESDRADLPNADPVYVAHTAYPDSGYTAAELRYNRLDPFKWSWSISLLALACFSLAFGVARRPMFWAGMLVLAAGLAWAAYGFYLRVSVTRWAPVTNMYETVIYVPFFVSLLGLWFALLPILWPGVKRAWRLTAIPFTWEARDGGSKLAQALIGAGPSAPTAGDGRRGQRPPRGADDPPLGRMQFSLANLLMLVPRAGLMIFVFWLLTMASYAAGDRPVFKILERPNDVLTWIAGLFLVGAAVWFLPRVMLTAAASLVLVPMSLVGRREELFPQVYQRRAFVGAATFVGSLCWYVAWSAPILDGSFTPLQPVLRDNFWLTIHVLTIVSSYGAGALAWGLGNLALLFYLFGSYRKPASSAALPAGHRPAGDVADETEVGARPPETCSVLASYIYKAIQVAVLLLALGTILGGVWADESWGRFWGWDPKEVWALISLLTYLAILHGRYAGLFGNFGLAVGSVLGASAIVFSWYGVNFYLGAGLHSYGFGAGGQMEVMTGVLANWVLLAAAGMRYWIETSAPASGAASGSASAAEPATRTA